MRAADIEIIINSMSDGSCFAAELIVAEGRLQVLGDIEIEADRLIVHGLHIDGDPTVRWGWSKLRQVGQAVAEKFNVDHVIIHGAVRTTGANPGRRPRAVRLSRPPKP